MQQKRRRRDALAAAHQEIRDLNNAIHESQQAALRSLHDLRVEAETLRRENRELQAYRDHVRWLVAKVLAPAVANG